ncbi:MAG: stage V sporulation T C-terminal domain-containing protein, partial [Bacilli bacterium]|nr:stage V sporulation T C-terminal domain-containing protein [Bacilli bacterium]
MKSTGVVRRIDDLGRIVIPKEIRRSLRIREGDSLEICSDGPEGITLRKYSQVETIESFINQYVDAIYQSSKKEIIVTDTERIIAAAGSFRRDIIGKKVDIRLDERMHRLTTQIFQSDEHLEVTDNL